ncbi:histidine kinase [uncultured Tenacibaculum sp.]|uniref:sensor histidine kinase n=1 Tax=uncultured Tenacibaculum sp. TaxID=174713 RepID=UPI0026267DED|nr:histidine kinase [uncultured Tenacibaculum sp.]
MEVLRRGYKFALNIGIYDTNEREHKKIRLLNAFCLTWAICICFFMILDPFFSQSLDRSIVLHLFSFVTIVSVYGLQKHKKYITARVLFIVTLIVVTFIFANFIEPSRMMENFYFVYPLVALILIDNKKITISIMIFCWLLYYVPYKLIPGIYPIEIFNPLLLLSAFVGCYVILNYSQSLNLKNEKKLEKAYQELEDKKKNELAHLQLKSLKAQMNPHFMFNALNSIQSLILKEDKHAAYVYLTKFASLIRENLNMSEKSFVHFEEELSLLKKYLELEKLRFKNDFKYQIKGIENIGDIKIPSMIIQPFVENSIKHGLLHKIEGKKELTVSFSKGEVFKCEIIDNGVGLEKSKEINKLNNKEKSFSTSAIYERLSLLKEFYKTDIGFVYEEALEGVKVVIRIPYTI